MKSTALVIAKTTSLLLFFCLFSIKSLIAQSPEGVPNCKSCKCGNPFCICESGRCCPPNQPTCNCTFFTCACSCGSANNSVVNFENVSSFSTFLRTPQFSSSAANNLASKFEQMVTALNTNDKEAYYSLSVEAESIARVLPTVEKQRVNAWLQSKGGTTLLP